MKERLQELLKKKGYTSLKFAEIMEVQPSSISHILSGRNKPSFDFIEKLLERFPEISPDWLILGRGGMYRENEEKKEEGNNGVLQEEETPQIMTNTLPLFFDDTSLSVSERSKKKVLSEQSNIDNFSVEDTKQNNQEIKVTNVNNKIIEKIIILYKNREFKDYNPE